MVGCAIRVLGRVEVRIEGRPVPLPAQQLRVLAMLVAAGAAAVPRAELVDALWRAPPVTDRLSPVISRLRTLLAGCGVAVTTAHGQHTYRLRPVDEGVGLADVVDAYRFEALAADARGILASARPPTAALAAFHQAEVHWHGAPFGALDEDWALPRVCRDAEARWTGIRSRMLAAWALRACW